MNDIDKMSLSELKSLRTKVERAITDFEDRKRREAIAAAEETARGYGFSLNDLTGGKASGKRGSKAAAKYAHPDDASQTWTGRGRRPKWVQDALSDGKKLEDLAI